LDRRKLPGKTSEKKMTRATKTAQYRYKMRTCEVCGREYRAFPQKGNKGGISYKGTCPHCGTYDGSRTPGHGHIKLNYENNE
jgi:hypothetical protein